MKNLIARYKVNFTHWSLSSRSHTVTDGLTKVKYYNDDLHHVKCHKISVKTLGFVYVMCVKMTKTKKKLPKIQ